MTAPSGYVDLQVNGYAGVDFNQDGLSPEALHAACAQLRKDGVAGILATLITAPLERMGARLERLVGLRELDPLVAEVIWGIHIEGPFINETPGFAGAHPVTAVIPADAEAMARLLEAAGGLTRVVTLAPERDSGLRVTRFLADRGIVVSAGHCNPTLDELTAAIDSGLSMFTHLGNGCPGELDRHDNIIQRALSLCKELWLCFIADGVHVPFPALGNYLRCAGLERSIVVTDAMAAAGMGPGRYSLAGQTVEVGDDLVTRIPGDETHLAGSAATMSVSTEKLRTALQLNDEQILQLTSDNPRRVLDEHGNR